MRARSGRRGRDRRSWPRSWTDSRSPAIVAGAGADDPETRPALAARGAPSRACRSGVVRSESRVPAGSPALRRRVTRRPARIREKLATHDVLLVVGAPVFRQSPYAERSSDRARHEDRRRRRQPRRGLTAAPPSGPCSPRPARLSGGRGLARGGQPSRPRVPAAAGTAAARSGELLRAGRLSALVSGWPRRPSRRGGARRPARAPRAPARAPAARLPQRRDGGLGFALAGATGSQAFPDIPVVAVVAMDRRCTGSRRSGARPTTSAPCS